MKNIELYHALTMYGDVYPLTIKCDPNSVLNHANQYQFVQYNPRKDIPRKGLSIFSLDGGMSGVPDLDSLKIYNEEYGTNHSERHFDVPTPVFTESVELQEFLKPFKGNLFRSHFIRLNPGGYFPPHRDMYGINMYSFRIVVPLKNVNPPNVMFGFGGEASCVWQKGSMYFFNTNRTHYLVNMSHEDSDWMVLNVALNEDTVNTVSYNLMM